MVYNTVNEINTGGACVSRLRGSNQTSTLEYSSLAKLEPDADNAAVGSHTERFFTGGVRWCLLFLFCYKLNNGELDVSIRHGQAERKV